MALLDYASGRIATNVRGFANVKSTVTINVGTICFFLVWFIASLAYKGLGGFTE